MRYSRRPIPKEETPPSQFQHSSLPVPQVPTQSPNILAMSPQGILKLQRTLGNRAVRNLLQRGIHKNSKKKKSKRIVRRRRPFDEFKRLPHAYIYEIVATKSFNDRHFKGKVSKGDVVYRGKTIQPLRTRYRGHLRDAKHTEWKGVTKIKLLEDGSGKWTPLELAANEQWWIEKQGFGFLGNRIKGLRRGTFRKYKNSKNFSYARANLPSKWEPSL